MRIAPPTADEPRRLALLRALELLDSAPEPAFDALTRLTARLLNVPIALVSLVDERRQWFKSRVGLDASETPRDYAFCAHAIHGHEPFVVPDAEADDRFADNPLVTGEPHVRAYAGVPLRSADGHALGTLCAIDHQPRSFSVDELSLLQELAEVARREILHREATLGARAVAADSQRARHEIEAFDQATFESVAIGIALVGLDGAWLRINPALCAILGRSAGELLGMTFQDVTHPDDLALDLGLVQQLLAGEADHYTMEKRYLRPDASVVWVNLTVTLVSQQGRPHHFISVLEDITARRETEEALRQLRLQLEQRVAERTGELQRTNDFLSDAVRQRQQSEAALAQSEADLRAVLENAQDAFVSIDAAGMVTEWNRQAERTFGWTRAEALGRRLEEMVIPLAHRSAHRQGMQHLVRTGEGRVLGQRLELPALRRDGRVIPCEVTITALPSTGKGQVYAAFLHDISDRKTAERLLADSERRMNAIVNDQTDIVCRFDARGQLLFANSTCRKLFGLTDANVAGATWQTVVWAEDMPAVAARLKTLSPTHPMVVTENRFVDSLGDVRWAEFVNRGFFNEAGELTEVQTVGRDVTDRKLLEARLALATERQQDLYDHAPCGYYSLDAEGRFVEINRTGLSWLGCERDEVIGKLGPIDFFTAEGRARFSGNYPNFVACGQAIGPIEFDLLSRDGSARRVSVAATAQRDAQGVYLRSRSVMYDVSELERVRRELQRLNREQHLMLDNELIGIVKLRDRRVVWKNRAFEQMFGYGPGELDDQPTRLLYPDDASCAALAAAAYPELKRGNAYRTQIQMVKKSGEPVWADLSGVLLSEDTDESMWLMLDITPMKQYQTQVEQLAYFDVLTGLPNRRLLIDRLGQALAACARSNGLLAVCFIDLDGFKAVNDRLGHEAGDKLLRVVATRLQECVRGNDTVARLGGDEFVLALSHLGSREECRAVLDRVLNAVCEPIALGGGQHAEVSASIGVAFYPEDGATGAELLGMADAAMYEAKQAGRNRVCSR